MKRTSKILFIVAAVSLICFFATRFLVGIWIPFLWIPLGFFIGSFFGALIQERQTIVNFMGMKTTKHGMNMGALIALVLVVLVVVNFLAVRHYKVWDFSGTRSNTLSDQSTKLIKALDSELLIRFFYKKGVEGNEENRKSFRELIKKYQDQSDKVKLEFVEVNERPDIAEQYGVTKGSGVIFLDYKGRRNRVEKIDEQEVTTALVKVTREKDKNIYFVVGHGEHDLNEEKEAEGLHALKQMIENNRYTVKTIATNLNAKIPDDADAVMIIGPTQKFLDYEIQGLENYLKRGGSLLLALKSKQTQGLEVLLNRVGLEPMNNYILNLVETPTGKGIQKGQTLATVFSNTSEITKVFGKNEATVFRNPMSFKRVKVPEGISIDDLIKTPENSMAFQTLEIKEEGPQGAYTLMAMAKGRYAGGDKDFELIAAGDADFLGNQLLYQSLNRDLVLNSVASLAKEQSLISVVPKETQVTKLQLTDSNFYMFLLLFAVPIPLALLGTSVTLWMRRRHA
ncbi:GldG family protein [Bdellovibrio sp. HCB337]|uniref:GldG family protein n=1 Tax=Bdellovibrio sp. HCB337 TaxID=3394358 RepID=UPI0039A4DFFD